MAQWKLDKKGWWNIFQVIDKDGKHKGYLPTRREAEAYCKDHKGLFVSDVLLHPNNTPVEFLEANLLNG